MSATKLVLKSTTSTSLNDRFSQIMGSRRTEEPTRVKKISQKNVQNSAKNARENKFGISEIILSRKCLLLFCSQKLHEREFEFGIPNFPALER
jgi:hypothetical protein